MDEYDDFEDDLDDFDDDDDDLGDDDGFDDDDDFEDDEGDAQEDDYHDASYYENLGMEDGRFDRDNHMLPYSGFGSSVNLDELDDDAREAYEMGYSIGAEDYDLSDD